MSPIALTTQLLISLPSLPALPRLPKLSEFPLHNVTEAIWAGSGALLAGAVIVSLDSIASQALAHRRRLDPGRSWEAATNAVRGVVRGDPAAGEVFTEMLRGARTRDIVIEALTNEARLDPDVARCLRGRAEDMESISRLVTSALADKDPGRRAYACEVVAMLRLRSGRGAVLAATTDEDTTVRVAACRSLAVIDPDASVGVLLGILDTEGPWAASLLGDVVQRLPIDGVLALLRRVEDWGASPALVRLLANIPSGGANQVLIDSLDDDNPDVRARSAEAIDPTSLESRDALVALLTDPDETTRLGAVRSLARVNHGGTALPLYAALNDSSRVVRMAAADGISRLPGGVALLRRARASTSEPLASEAADLALWYLDSDGTVQEPPEVWPPASPAQVAHSGPADLPLPPVVLVPPAPPAHAIRVTSDSSGPDPATADQSAASRLLIEALLTEVNQQLGSENQPKPSLALTRSDNADDLADVVLDDDEDLGDDDFDDIDVHDDDLDDDDLNLHDFDLDDDLDDDEFDDVALRFDSSVN